MSIGPVPFDQTYNEHFYRKSTEGSLSAARRILPHIWKLKNFDSVIDVGCGVGAWLSVAQELGAKTVHGIEGHHVPAEMLLVPDERISRQDLSISLNCQGNYALCLCLEVAEHLPPARAQTLIDELTSLSEVVAFSAAIPFQGGDGHLNETWPEVWADLFDRHGYAPSTQIRDAIWNIAEIPWWYRQNLILFVKRSIWKGLLGPLPESDPRRLTAIHPESYLWSVRRPSGRFSTTQASDLEAYYSAVNRKPHPPTAYGQEFALV
jgi:hypothetical protein